MEEPKLIKDEEAPPGYENFSLTNFPLGAFLRIYDERGEEIAEIKIDKFVHVVEEVRLITTLILPTRERKFINGRAYKFYEDKLVSIGD